MDYFFIFLFSLVSFLISILIMVLSSIFTINNTIYDKLTTYECGFNPFSDCLRTFDIQFYVVAILFIIFDIEISFLFPWSMKLIFLGLFSFFIISLFIIVLWIGIIFELSKEALDWY